MKRLIAKYGKLGRAYEYLAVVDKTLDGGAGRLGFSAAAALRTHQPAEEVRRHRRAGNGFRPRGDRRRPQDWTYDAQLKMAEACCQGWLPVRIRLRLRQHRRQPDLGRHVRRVRRRPGQRQGQHHHRLRQRDGGDGIRQKMVQVHAARFGELGRCVEQPRADLRQGRAISGIRPRPGRSPSAMRRRWRRIAGPSPIQRGPKGRLVPHRPYFWGIWSFAQNKTAAKELIEHLSQREQVEQLAAPVAGYDIPPFLSMYDMKVWSEVEPPKGTDLQLSAPAMARRGILYPRLLRAARDRRADLEPLSDAGHGGPAHVRPVDQAVDRLGQGRAGGLRPLTIPAGGGWPPTTDRCYRAPPP